MVNIQGKRLVRCCFGLLFLLMIAGCKDKPKTVIKGKITYKNQPVTSGSVNFYMASKGSGGMANLDANGTFTIQESIEPGSYKVYLSPPPPEQLPPGSVSKQKKYDIPPKYQDPSQSPISKDVVAGNNEFNIDFPE